MGVVEEHGLPGGRSAASIFGVATMTEERKISQQERQGDELSDDALEDVAGGTKNYNSSRSNKSGAAPGGGGSSAGGSSSDNSWG